METVNKNIQLTEGLKMKYEIADFDACDNYNFIIKQFSKEGLTFDYQMLDEDGGVYEEGNIFIEDKALKESDRLVSFSQSNYDVNNVEEKSIHCPIFIVSQRMYEDLINKKSSKIKTNNFDDKMYVEFYAITNFPLIIDGKETEVEAIQGVIKNDSSYEDNIWILNNPEFPLVLEVQTDFTGGDNGSKLKEIIINN